MNNDFDAARKEFLAEGDHLAAMIVQKMNLSKRSGFSKALNRLLLGVFDGVKNTESTIKSDHVSRRQD